MDESLSSTALPPATSSDKKSEDPPPAKPFSTTTTKRNNNNNSNNSNNTNQSFLTKYFLIILFFFACLSLFLNTQFTHIIVEDVSTLEFFLEKSVVSRATIKVESLLAHSELDRKDDDDDDENDNDDDDDGSNNNNKNKANNAMKSSSSSHHDLNCDAYGGPEYPAAQEMVYWKDIPSDAKYMSPFHHHHHHQKDNLKKQQRQFMTFEPDHGGWNNIRMAMETVLTMSFAMGRTLVLPPHQKMYLLGKNDEGQRNEFSFEHFFHMERISQEHVGLDIISMQEFLQDFVMKGIFINPKTQQPMYPPNNRTDWNGCSKKELNTLYQFLRNNITSTVLLWNPEECLASFPKSTDPTDLQALKELQSNIETTSGGGFPDHMKFVNHPVPINGTPEQRLQENWANRKKLCIYDENLQQQPWVHFPVGHKKKGEIEARLLVHFYAFLFFQDWKQDLWMKRFVRDHVRYIDEIQCAAARIVQGIRQHVLRRTNGTSSEFDTLHVRRGDFQYTVTRVEAMEIYKQTSKNIPDGSTIYIATDERKKEFFNPLKDHYDVVFLDDFLDRISGINTNYYGMVDQLVATRGRYFFGCWFSTFTGYINRLRGYHHHKVPTNEESMGIIPSYYYALPDRYDHMQQFWPVKKSFYAREFPTSWRLIDMDIQEDEAEDNVATS